MKKLEGETTKILEKTIKLENALKNQTEEFNTEYKNLKVNACKNKCIIYIDVCSHDIIFSY